MKRTGLAPLAIAAFAGWLSLVPAHAAPPTVTPSPGYDARLQEQRAAARAIVATGRAESLKPAPAASRQEDARTLTRRRANCAYAGTTEASSSSSAWPAAALWVEQPLQFVDALGEPRPFAGERILGAVGRPDARGLLDRARHRHRHLFEFRRWRPRLPGAQRDLLHVLGLRSRWRLRLLLGHQRRGDAVAPFALEIGGILLVDFLLLFRRRVRACDVEGPVLHEIVIGVTAAGLAAAGEFRIAFGERCRLFFFRLRLLGHVGA